MLLAQVLRDNRQDLPATLPELYSKYLELALGRWDISKGLQSQQEYEVLETVLMELANYLLKNNLDFIGVPELQQRIAVYLEERNLRVQPDVIFEKAVDRSEVLARDGHIVRFKHRSFAEFLEAKRRIRRGTVSPSLKAFEMYWANIYYFAVGEMKDAPDFIEKLSALVPEKESHRWLKSMNMANYIMAAYATPYQVIEETVYQSVLQTAKLFDDIVKGQHKSYFGKLSRMELLCLMQLIIRDHYGFEFLGPAIEGAAIRVMEEEHGDVGPYCLFLLAVASIDAGRQDALQTWLEACKGKLPIDVSLGIVHEETRETPS